MSSVKNEDYNGGFERHLFIIFGATGDLSRRKLFPAIYRLSARGVLRQRNIILGVARRKLDDQGFRALGEEILESSGLAVNGIYSPWCSECLYYQSVGNGSPVDYERLATRIRELETKNNLSGNRVFYMALPPEAVRPAIVGLGEARLNRGSGWVRLVLEKPFGNDLASSQELNQLVQRYFSESQIYRIDHYLGKETVQNLLIFRFANTIFEELWNREHIDSIQITAAEDIGIESRAVYYDQTGALCDMVQNHLTQLLTLVAMETPADFEAEAIRFEKTKVLRQVMPIKPEDVVYGQYTRGKIGKDDVVGYTEEEGIPKSSKRETFVALKLEIANWRWKGVPFYIRTGKRLARRLTQIVVLFHSPPISIFSPYEPSSVVGPNILIITIQPEEGFDLQIQVKAVGKSHTPSTQRLHFQYSEVFGSIPEAYETLLLDIVAGDQTHFVSSEWVERSWNIYTPILGKNIQVHPYTAGTWGPAEGDQLLARDSAKWLNVLD